jgi:hypothetical protein
VENDGEAVAQTPGRECVTEITLRLTGGGPVQRLGVASSSSSMYAAYGSS